MTPTITSSQWLDFAILAIALVAAISGWRSGAVGSLLSFIGVVLGAVAGVLLAPHVVTHIDGDRARLFATLFLILALVVIGEVAGVVLGRAARSAIRYGPLRVSDSVIGVGLQLVAVLLAAWLLATPLASSAGQPSLAAAVKGSKVLTEVDKLAPEWLQAVPQRISALLDDSGLPEVLQPLNRTHADVGEPDATLSDDAVVALTAPSVVKIQGIAEACGKVLEGSGFVISPERVMSNAHVVAGADRVTIELPDRRLDATVVSYDPDVDISILAVPGLSLRPLQFAEGEAKPGTDAVVMGFPGGGGFVATPARVRETITLNGPDIYQDTTVTRQVYTVRGEIRQGNSGGPMIDRSGQVLGVVFGAAVDDAGTGFVLTGKQVEHQVARVGYTEPVPTGACVGAPGR